MIEHASFWDVGGVLVAACAVFCGIRGFLVWWIASGRAAKTHRIINRRRGG